MNCIVCGNRIRHSYYFKMRMCGKKCYNKWRWDGLLNDDAIIIQGRCYHIKNYPIIEYLPTKHYIVRMFETGKIIETNNLWCEGEIPKEYKKQDNAEFLLKI